MARQERWLGPSSNPIDTAGSTLASRRWLALTTAQSACCANGARGGGSLTKTGELTTDGLTALRMAKAGTDGFFQRHAGHKAKPQPKS